MGWPLTIPDFATVGIFCVNVVLVIIIIVGTWIQFNYYRKTTRPFVYVGEDEYKKSPRPDNSFVLTYKIINAGTLPAKEVISKSFLSKEISKYISDFNYPQEMFCDIYPNLPFVSGLSDGDTRDIEIFREKPYLHITVKYKDISGKVYYYRTIRHINVEAPYDIKLIWSDFD